MPLIAGRWAALVCVARPAVLLLWGLAVTRPIGLRAGEPTITEEQPYITVAPTMAVLLIQAPQLRRVRPLA